MSLTCFVFASTFIGQTIISCPQSYADEYHCNFLKGQKIRIQNEAQNGLFLDDQKLSIPPQAFKKQVCLNYHFPVILSLFFKILLYRLTCPEQCFPATELKITPPSLWRLELEWSLLETNTPQSSMQPLIRPSLCITKLFNKKKTIGMI